MLLKWCPHCGCRVDAGGFCGDCKSNLKFAGTRSGSGPEALYRYQGVLRSVILRAKVNNENTSYLALCDLFTCHPVAIELGLQADIIVPVPSSLWGRVRGKFDLAQGIAFELGRALDRPIELFPSSFYFNYRKRAGQNNAALLRKRYGKSMSERWSQKTVLLIDDIMTTGFTIASLTRILTENHVNVLPLVLASAAAHGISHNIDLKY